MKVIRNKLIPFPGFVAVNLLGLAFVRSEEWDELPEFYRRRVVRHESIHTAQMLELLVVPFYIIYFAEWLVRLLQDPRTAYERISFEREAYAHEGDPDYLDQRKHYAQFRREAHLQ